MSSICTQYQVGELDLKYWKLTSHDILIHWDATVWNYYQTFKKVLHSPALYNNCWFVQTRRTNKFIYLFHCQHLCYFQIAKIFQMHSPCMYSQIWQLKLILILYYDNVMDHGGVTYKESVPSVKSTEQFTLTVQSLILQKKVFTQFTITVIDATLLFTHKTCSFRGLSVTMKSQMPLRRGWPSISKKNLSSKNRIDYKCQVFIVWQYMMTMYRF